MEKIYNNHTIITAKIHASILDNHCVINVSWDNPHKERIIQILNDGNHLRFDFNKEKIVMTNESVKEIDLIQKEEPLFNSISCFINSIEQPNKISNIKHMKLNNSIMYIVEKILDN